MISLWDTIARGGGQIDGAFLGVGETVKLADLRTGGTLGGMLESLRGLSVLLATEDQLPTAVALVELDGVAKRIVLCTPDLTLEMLGRVAAAAEASVVVQELRRRDIRACGITTGTGIVPVRLMTLPPVPGEVKRQATESTEWVLLTSGTTGQPKLVAHTLQSLAGSLIRPGPVGRSGPVGEAPTGAGWRGQGQTGLNVQERIVWSTFYDIRRYGGLQIFLRAVLSGSPLVLSSPGESTRDFLARAAAAGVTHISGTPSHWRRALMSGEAGILAPEYVRLSGEVADQALLDNLQATYPNARIAHAFASTEAGLAFDVNDGLAGFPATLIAAGAAADGGEIQLKVLDGTLRIRSGRMAAGYLGGASSALKGDDGYVDTGDLVELKDGRYHFRGRRGGIINVGGLKVFPEEVESVLNADPRVRMSLVRARRNPITGAVVVAEVVLQDSAFSTAASEAGLATVKAELLNACRRALPAHKVPAMLRFVPTLELTAAGKLVRPSA